MLQFHPVSLFRLADGEGASSVSTIAALQEEVSHLKSELAHLEQTKAEDGGGKTALQGEVSELKLELVRLEQSKAEDDGVIEGLKTQLAEMTFEKEGKADPPAPPTESDKVGPDELSFTLAQSLSFTCHQYDPVSVYSCPISVGPL